MFNQYNKGCGRSSLDHISNEVIRVVIQKEIDKALAHFNVNNLELIHKINWSLLGDDTTFYDLEMRPLCNGRVFTYKAGTNELLDSYSDYSWEVKNGNPILLDEFGKANVHLKGIYDLHVFDSNNELVEVKKDVINGFAAEEIINARRDLKDFEDFMSKPSNYVVERRKSTPLKTLDYHVDELVSLVDTSSNLISNLTSQTIKTVNDAINNTAVEGGVLADTFVTVTANGTGAVARTQREVNADSVSAKAFGAKGNGVADDTLAIQAAIDHVNSIGGGTVTVPDGTYMIKADNPDSLSSHYLHDEGGIALKDNVHLKLSTAAILKAIPTKERRYNVVRSFNKKNVAISGGRILGERDQHIAGGQVGEWGYGIAVTGSEEVSISNIDVEKCYGDGLNLQVAYIDGVPISPKGVYIDNIRSLHNRRQGISIEAGYDVFITRSEFSYTGGTEPASGIDIEPWSPDAVVKNITIDGCVLIDNAKKGIIVGGAGDISNIRITNNFLSGNQSGAGAGQITVYCPQEVYRMRDVDIINNRVVGGGDCDYGILVFDTHNTVVKGNTLKDCSLGLSGFAGNSNITYSDNTVTVSTLKGVSQLMNIEAGLDNKYKNIKIVNNTFNFLEGLIAGGDAPTIYLRGHGTEFIGNTVIGVGTIDSMGDNIKIVDNSLQDISVSAITVTGANTEIKGNSVHHAGYVSFASGVGIAIQAVDCIVLDNSFFHDSLNTIPPTLVGKKLVSAIQLAPELSKGSYVRDNMHPSDVGLINWGYAEFDVTVASTSGFSGSVTPISSTRPIGFRFYNTTSKKQLINTSTGWFDLLGNVESYTYPPASVP